MQLGGKSKINVSIDCGCCIDLEFILFLTVKSVKMEGFQCLRSWKEMIALVVGNANQV
jgi:hypothetical protein